MNLGQFIAEKVIQDFKFYKPERIRFLGHDNWLVNETIRAFHNRFTGVLICDDRKYNGFLKYDKGLLWYSDDSFYQVDVGGLFALYRKEYQTGLLNRL